MGYVQNSLTADEKIVYTAKLHWIVFLWPVIFFLIALLSLKAPALCGVFIVLAFITAAYSLIKMLTSEFAVTTKRVVMKTGLSSKNSSDVFLNKIEGCNVNQGLLGNMLNFGTVVVGGTGGSKEGFKHVANPMEFRKTVQNQIDATTR